MTTEPPDSAAMPPPVSGFGSSCRRDPRIDMLRGLSLMMIFIDHIPYNSLSRLTLRSFGFSDAAEIFVFLAGYSSFMAYPWVFDREGAVAGWIKIACRCINIWGTHALLLLGSVAIVILRQKLTGRPATAFVPLLDNGLGGLLRGLTLQALPAYLDILPLYIVLIASFPLVMFGVRRSALLTLLASLAIHAAATLAGWNLPNQIDPRAAATVWTFNPFTWQLVFVLGALMAHGRSQGWPWLRQPPPALIALCVAILVFGFLAVDGCHLWPRLAAWLFPPEALASDWKTAAPPWRVLHSLALLTLLLNSRRFAAFSNWSSVKALKACGRFSLQVFSMGCILALLGRIAYVDLGPTPMVQFTVNVTGILLQLTLAWRLQHAAPDRRAAAGRAAPAIVPGALA